MAMSAFYTPNHFLSPGITGIAMLVEYITGLPKFVMMIVLNIPVMVIGVKYMNIKFIVFSTIATLFYSIMFEIPFVANFSIDLGENSQILSAIIGPVVLGITGVPVVKRGASLGGMDVVSVVLSRKFSIQIGTINIAYNLVIMVVLGFFYGAEVSILSMLAIFVSNTAFNYMMQGMNHKMSVFVISEKWEEIAPHLMAEMHRGVTFLNGEGAYTGQPRKIVYCIVKTTELSKLKNIVKAHDPKALFSIIETKEVVGRGFGAMN